MSLAVPEARFTSPHNYVLHVGMCFDVRSVLILFYNSPAGLMNRPMTSLMLKELTAVIDNFEAQDQFKCCVVFVSDCTNRQPC